MRVLLRSPINTLTGYGNDGVGIIRALVKWGADVYLQPLHVDPPLPPDVLQLFTKHLEPPFDLAIAHQDPASLRVSKQLREVSEVCVGWTMWEWNNMESLDNRFDLKERLSPFDTVFSYSDLATEALKPYREDVVTLQGGYDPSEWPEVERDWFSGPLRFLITGVQNGRKNPWVAIEAFKELRDEYPEEFNAQLHLHTTEPGFHPHLESWCPGLFIYRETLREDHLKALYAKSHVLLSPSRGEGKNLPALQMLSSGGTVVATEYSGHLGWLSAEYAYPLNYKLIPFKAGVKDSVWADADKDHLKQIMLHIVRNRFEAKRKGEIAASVIPKMCSWTSVFERFFLHMEHLGHESLATKARDARLGAKENDQFKRLTRLER